MSLICSRAGGAAQLLLGALILMAPGAAAKEPTTAAPGTSVEATGDHAIETEDRTTESAEPGASVATAQLRPELAEVDDRLVHYTAGIAFTTKNLSLGISLRYFDFLQTNLATDFLLTTLLTGFAHDDLDALRLSASHAVGARLRFDPIGLAPWHGERQLPAPYPDFVVGLAGHCVIEVDNLSQAFRLGDPGFFIGLSVGAFVSFVFDSVSVALHLRPLGRTGYFLNGVWDGTDFQVRNATIDVDLTYTLPW